MNSDHTTQNPNNKYTKDFISIFKAEFTKRIQLEVKSRKEVFVYTDAVLKSIGRRTEFDSLMIDYLRFINSKPLQNNDYFKYLDSYVNGKELNLKYFKHDTKKLKAYYSKFDKNNGFNPFNIERYNDYVLFMMLKIKKILSQIPQEDLIC